MTVFIVYFLNDLLPLIHLNRKCLLYTFTSYCFCIFFEFVLTHIKDYLHYILIYNSDIHLHIRYLYNTVIINTINESLLNNFLNKNVP